MNAPKLKRVMRLDSMPLSKAHFTPEGFLIDKPVVTSCGIFEYSNPDGSIRRELRLPEDVFAPESLKTFRGKPIIITHDSGLIDSQNVAENQIGTILSDGERKNDDVVCDIIIHNTDAMKSCGFKELSLGYNLDLDETPGEWNGQRYDAVQKNIVINHLALVREARAGDQARLNLDSRDNHALKGGKTMGAKNSKIRSTHHGDDVLTQEEFEKAIDEYKKRKAEREGTAQVDAEEEPIEETKNVPAVPAKPENETAEIEDKVAAVRGRRDLRDEAGDPKDEEEALTTIAHQDEDLDILFDIIDTLLAKQDFAAAKVDADDIDVTGEVTEEVEEEPEEEMDNAPVGGVDDMNVEKKNIAQDAEDEEFVEEEDEEFAEDAEDEEILPEEEEEETQMDAEDEELIDEEEEEEDVEMDGCGEDDEYVRQDSVDAVISRGIRDHMMMGNLGRQVGIKNLEYKSIKAAKKAIIKAVRPDMRLDGKSDTYINSAFDYAKKEIKARNKKDTNYQKKQMFNKDSRGSEIKKDSAMSARERMIARQQKH